MNQETLGFLSFNQIIRHLCRELQLFEASLETETLLLSSCPLITVELVVESNKKDTYIFFLELQIVNFFFFAIYKAKRNDEVNQFEFIFNHSLIFFIHLT
jgi:hypothetical protein